MKKIALIVLTSVLLMILVGCGGTDNWKDKFRIDVGADNLVANGEEYGKKYLISNFSYESYDITLVLEFQYDEANNGESWEVTFPFGKVDFLGSAEGDVSFKKIAEDVDIEWNESLMDAFTPVSERVDFTKV